MVKGATTRAIKVLYEIELFETSGNQRDAHADVEHGSGSQLDSGPPAQDGQPGEASGEVARSRPLLIWPFAPPPPAATAREAQNPKP